MTPEGGIRCLADAGDQMDNYHEVMKGRRLDGRRIAILSAATAALAVGMAAALLYHSSRMPHVGPTPAALSDGFSELGSACLGLAIGAFGTAMVVRRGSRLGSGIIAGVIAFFVGVVPYSWLTAPSDVSTSDNIGWLVIVFIPAVMLVTVGAALGEALGGRRHWHRKT
jgi:hypothetical protein